MARFIELPYAGPFNAETQKQERLFMTVNCNWKCSRSQSIRYFEKEITFE